VRHALQRSFTVQLSGPTQHELPGSCQFCPITGPNIRCACRVGGRTGFQVRSSFPENNCLNGRHGRPSALPVPGSMNRAMNEGASNALS